MKFYQYNIENKSIDEVLNTIHNTPRFDLIEKRYTNIVYSGKDFTHTNILRL